MGFFGLSPNTPHTMASLNLLIDTFNAEEIFSS